MKDTSPFPISDEKDNISTEELQIDTLSHASSSSLQDQQDDYQSALSEMPAGCFGNISVMNSNEVHFGNKTVYQGPVTIKQILYNNNKTNNGLNNGSAVENQGFQNSASDNCVTDSVNGNSNVYTSTSQEVNQNRKDWLPNVARSRAALAALIISLILIVFVVLATVLYLRRNNNDVDVTVSTQTVQGESNELDLSKPGNYTPSLNITLPEKVRVVLRHQWVAQPPIHPYTLLSLPVPLVIIMHTATESCSSQGQCSLHVRYIQSFHVDSNGWDDIGYNFLVGGDGSAYEGRGWKAQGANVYGFNNKAIGIAFVGLFINQKPPQQQLLACKKLIEIGVKSGAIRKDYKLLGASQLSPTQSPGDALLKEIKTWPHWSDAP